MSTMTPDLTRTGRPKVAPLDSDRIRAEEIAAVDATLSTITDPRERLEKAAAIIAEAEGILAEQDPYMKKLALSLALHEGARGVSHVIGMHRSGFYQLTEKVLGDPVQVEKRTRAGKTTIKTKYVWPERPAAWDETVSARATEKKIRRYRNAAEELPEVAADVVAAKARIDAAEAVRDAAVPEVVASGVAPVDVARIINRHPSRISHLLRAANE